MQEAGQDARLAAFLADVLTSEGISQTELARRAGVSQSAVSRALHQRSIRRGPARSRLVDLMHQGGFGRGTERFEKAFRRVWDGSVEHAEALARIISACEGLRPVPAGRGEDDS